MYTKRLLPILALVTLVAFHTNIRAQDMSTLQANVDAAKARLSSAQNRFDSAKTALDTAQAKYDEASTALNKAKTEAPANPSSDTNDASAAVAPAATPANSELTNNAGTGSDDLKARIMMRKAARKAGFAPASNSSPTALPSDTAPASADAPLIAPAAPDANNNIGTSDLPQPATSDVPAQNPSDAPQDQANGDAPADQDANAPGARAN